MCLQTTWMQPKVAEEDITVYKNLTIKKNNILQVHISILNIT